MFAANNHHRSNGEGPIRQHQSYGRPGPSSEAIPMPSSHVHRTKSELDLVASVKVAQERDLAMLHRVMDGIRNHHRAMRRSGASLAEHVLFDENDELHLAGTNRNARESGGAAEPAKDLTFPRLSETEEAVEDRDLVMGQPHARLCLDRATLPSSDGGDGHEDNGQWYLDECHSLSDARRRQKQPLIRYYNPPFAGQQVDQFLPEDQIFQAPATYYGGISGLDLNAALPNRTGGEEQREEPDPFQLEL